MPFAPGVSGNPAGRPKGSVNRKWADLSYWFSIIERNVNGLPAREQIAVAKWAMELLISKMKEIQSPEESRATAEAAQSILAELEAQHKK